MFWDSVRKTCFVPIVTLVVFLLHTAVKFIPKILYSSEEGVGEKYGYFWDFIVSSIFTPVLIVLFGIIAAITLFRFAQNKKQGNVIFSLGLSRREIFISKYLGGIAPTAVVLIFSATLEIFANVIAGCIVKPPIILLALTLVSAILAMYIFAFTIMAATTAFSGNIVESGIFAVIIGLFPNFLCGFIDRMIGAFTYGGIEIIYTGWIFMTPLMALYFMPIGEGYDVSDYLGWLYEGREKITVLDWAGTIACIVFSAIILTVVLINFPKRRNEISGYFGRARALNEICGAMVGFYVGTVSIPLGSRAESSKEIISFLSFILPFALAYTVFKLIFNHKRMKTMAKTAKRLVAYSAAFGVVTAIFATGLFGYSSYIPDAKDIESVGVSLEISNPYVYDGFDISRGEIYGYVQMAKYNKNENNAGNDAVDTIPDEQYLYGNNFPGYFYVIEDSKKIEKAVELHRAIAKEGRIKPNADNACGCGFLVEYTLYNGRTVRRYYDTVSTENAKKLLGLNDLTDSRENIEKYFYYHAESLGKLGVTDYLDGFCLLTKDLKGCKYIDGLSTDFADAVIADLEKQDSEKIFFHNPKDELGVIYLPTKDTLIGTSDMSISLSREKCIVVTKNMTNIVKYLTDNNLMQYFESNVTADDVQKIKIATRAETLSKKNADMLPLFTAGYATAEEVKLNNAQRDQANHTFANHVKTSIEDKNTIQTVLDNALLYGYNGNDDRVVEVTYNDGSIATYAIKADVYNKLNIK